MAQGDNQQPQDAIAAQTPHFVLLDDGHRIGPTVEPSLQENDCVPIYGFSGANAYGRFRNECAQALVPYPLVKTYLRSRLGAGGEHPRLVIIDAAGPRESSLHAATIEAVLKAQEDKAIHVAAAYDLQFDSEAGFYRVSEPRINSAGGGGDSLNGLL